ncbi:hypothetical protein [Sphingomonas sp. S2-65]|uniref:hypothetical protein n=1 Tax=Sphingomonas sp. S2-65 TaxID=2903960 RepID=UPI001F36CFDA|nr:hypothetical protein [Sphingomonas sp. S2-65]UYY59885.1 hypothetical protein LZ586_07305 [Sphingomonas sp. S2-65]
MVKMGTVWDRTAEFLGDNVSAILPVALFAFFVPASIGGNFAALRAGGGPTLPMVLALVELAFAVLSLWGTLAITAMGLDLVSDRSAGRVALSRLPAAVLVIVVLLAGVLLLAAPIPAVLAATGHDLWAMPRGEDFALNRPEAIFSAIYLVVLIGVTLWFGARLAVVTPAIVRERGALGSIARAWRLSRGHGWRILGVLVLYVVVSWVAQLAAQTVFGSVFELVAGGAGDGVTLAGVLTATVVAAVQAAFQVVLAAFTAKLYLALAAHDARRGDPAVSA